MAFMACSLVQQRKSSMAAAAMNADCSSGSTPSAESAIMAIMMVLVTMVLGPMVTTSDESENWSCEDSSAVCRLIRGGQAKSRVSPACNTTSRGDCLMRSPLRATATRIMLLSFSNVLPPIFVPISLLPNLT